MKKTLLYILLFQFYLYLCLPDIPGLKDVEYQLTAKNETGGDLIELKPGIYTKILFQLTPININSDNYYSRFFDKAIYLLLITDERIKVLHSQIHLYPYKDLVYPTYIGLKCDDYKIDKFPLKFKVIHLDHSTFNIPIKSEDIFIKITQVKNQINLNILMDSIPGKSLNYFKIKSELYNIDGISLEISKIDNFKFNDIYIKPFNLREEISEQNPEKSWNTF